MEQILFAFLALLGWGSGDIPGGIVARKIGGYSAVFWLYIFSILSASIYAPFAIGELRNLTLNTALILVCLSVGALIPMVALYKGIQVGNASLVGTIGAAFTSITVILSIVFLDERVSSSQIFSIIVIFLGVLLLSINFGALKGKNILLDRGFPYALISMVLWGVYFTFIKIPVREIGWFWPSYLALFSFPLIYIFMRINKSQLKFPGSSKILFLSILNAILLNLGAFAYNFAISKGETAVVAPIAGSYPLLFVALASFIFKDKITRQKAFGIIISLVGIISLSLFSSI